MDKILMISLCNLGAAAALAFSAMGSALGIGIAGAAAIGSWKKSLLQNKPALFLLIIFIGAPLSQTIYGMILMNSILTAAKINFVNWPAMIASGVFGGMAIGASAWFQGIIGAAAADAYSETNRGFGNYLMALGIVETVALFVMVFINIAINK